MHNSKKPSCRPCKTMWKYCPCCSKLSLSTDGELRVLIEMYTKPASKLLGWTKKRANIYFSLTFTMFINATSADVSLLRERKASHKLGLAKRRSNSWGTSWNKSKSSKTCLNSRWASCKRRSKNKEKLLLVKSKLKFSLLNLKTSTSLMLTPNEEKTIKHTKRVGWTLFKF